MQNKNQTIKNIATLLAMLTAIGNCAASVLAATTFSMVSNGSFPTPSL
jgi:hypothetical protein